MSNAARKARKRSRQDSIKIAVLGWGTPIDPPFQHLVKVKTHMHPTQARDFAKARDRITWGQGVENQVAHTERNKPLDPKPYRIGRKRYTEEEVDLEQMTDAIFSPRKQYQQEFLMYDV